MTPDNADRRGWIAAAAAIAVAFLLLTAPVLLSGRGGPSEFSDQERYHQVAINQMIDTWPRVDIRHYPSATSPGLHFVMAGVQAALGEDAGRLASRWLNLLLGLGLVLTVHRFATRFVGAWTAAIFVGPLLMSQYVLSGAIWLTTDNAALFFALLAVALALPERPSAARGVGAGVAAACAVGVRQIHLWTAAPLGWAALLASPLAAAAPGALRIWPPSSRRGSALVGGLVGAALPLGLMAWFFVVWGGLMPPMYAQKHNAGPNPATFAVAFALLGAFGVWFLPAVGVARDAARDWLVWTLAATGLLTAVLPATDFQAQERAFGALWRAVQLTPEIAHRSLLIAALATMGGAVIALLYRAAERAGRSGLAALLLLTLLGWALAQAMNSMAWQRYFEPVALSFLPWLAAIGAGAQPLRRRKPLWGVAVLIALQAVIAAASLYRETALYTPAPVTPPSAAQDGLAPD